MKKMIGQTWEILAINLKMKYKTLIFFGILIHIGIYLAAIAFPNIWEIFSKNVDTSYDANIVNLGMLKIDKGILIMATSISGFTNLTLGTYLVMKNYMVSKREFISMPYDLFPKLTALYIYMFMWVIINLMSIKVIQNLTLMIFRVNGISLAWFSPLENGIYELLWIFVTISYILVITMLWREKSFLYNMIILVGLLAVVYGLNIFITFALVQEIIKPEYKILKYLSEIGVNYAIFLQVVFSGILYLIFKKMNIKE